MKPIFSLLFSKNQLVQVVPNGQCFCKVQGTKETKNVTVHYINR